MQRKWWTKRWRTKKYWQEYSEIKSGVIKSKVALASITITLMAVPIVAVVFSLTGQQSATIYYIDCNSGNDLNDGTTAASALKTITRLNDTTESPKPANGDIILFKRGCVWRGEKITNTTAGLTYGAYGNEADPDPSIRGSYTYNRSFEWKNDERNLWYLSNINTDPVVFVHDGILGARKKSNDPLGKNGLTSQWDYWYDSNQRRLYVYSSENPVRFEHMRHQLEVAMLDQAFSTIWWNDVTVRDIDFRHFRGPVAIGFWGGVTGWNFDGVSISQVEIGRAHV